MLVFYIQVQERHEDPNREVQVRMTSGIAHCTIVLSIVPNGKSGKLANRPVRHFRITQTLRPQPPCLNWGPNLALEINPKCYV